MSIAAAPSVICDELPAVMAGAGWSADSHAGFSAASASREALRRMPSSVASISPVSSPVSASLTGTGTISPGKKPLSVFSAARRCDWSAYSSISSRVMPHLSASTCATQNWIPSVLFGVGEELTRERADAAARVRRHRRARHRLDAARDRDVVRAGDHALRDEVRGLLRRAALAVDARRRHLPRQPRGDPRVAGHVAALLPRLGHAAADDVVDARGIEVVALDTSSARTRPSRSVGCQPASAPLRLPNAVRPQSTMTASRAPARVIT